MDIKRVFLIVLDSVGIGALPDAGEYGDAGSDTLGACVRSGGLWVPNLASLGLFNIQGVAGLPGAADPTGSYARMAEASKGKDTTIGHWEIAGICSPKPLPTYPEGFPNGLLEEYARRTGRGILCNRPYSGTQVIRDYGRQHVETGDLIVYTSADSVFQVAAHEAVVPLEELYRCCEIARELMQGEHGVGRIIARPFAGESPDYVRTANRHDFSLAPPGDTMCDLLAAAGLATVGVGKIHDIFAGRGISRSVRISGNRDGMEKTMALVGEDIRGLVFVNLVDFDMLYGHRNDVAGYTAALNEFDAQLGEMMPLLGLGDTVILTADHGCDPSTPSTDHSREYTPMLAFGAGVRRGVDLGTRSTFADIAATVLDMLGVAGRVDGASFWGDIKQDIAPT